MIFGSNIFRISLSDKSPAKLKENNGMMQIKRITIIVGLLCTTLLLLAAAQTTLANVNRSYVVDANGTLEILFSDLYTSTQPIYLQIENPPNFGTLTYALPTVTQQIVDPNIGVSTDRALASVNGQPAIAYSTGSTGHNDLRYTYFDGQAWHIEVVTSTAGIYYPSLAEIDGAAAISYYDSASTALMYATRISGTWEISVVDSTSNVGRHNSLAVIDGRPAIAYRSWNIMKYAYFDGGSWTIEEAKYHQPDCDYPGSPNPCLFNIYVHGQISLAQSGATVGLSYMGNGNVIYAERLGTNWVIKPIAGADSDLGGGESILIPSESGFTVLWYDVLSARECEFDSTSTSFETCFYSAEYDGTSWSQPKAVPPVAFPPTIPHLLGQPTQDLVNRRQSDNLMFYQVAYSKMTYQAASQCGNETIELTPAGSTLPVHLQIKIINCQMHQYLPVILR